MKFTPLVPCTGCRESLVEPGRLCLECWEGGRVKDQPHSVVTAPYLFGRNSHARDRRTNRASKGADAGG